MADEEKTKGNGSEQSENPYVEKDPADMVLYEKMPGHIAKITLNRPEKGNAILAGVMDDELNNKFQMAQDDDEVKVIILNGNGRHFCAGEDTRRMPIETFGLKKGQKLPQSYRMRGAARNTEKSRTTVLYSSKTTIASCHGAVMGAGFRLALTCDMIVCADNAKFARRQSRIGFAGFDTLLPLTLLKLGVNRGYEAIITGRIVTAQEMKDWGTAASVVPQEKLEDETMRYAKAVAAHSTDSLMLGRHCMQMFWDLVGLGTYMNFFKTAHPLFTNVVWREDEANWFKMRQEYGPKEGIAKLHKIWEDLGFE
jgi:enoyl-CoA hydratase/carnithine racemase